jgi:hypothetical protein
MEAEAYTLKWLGGHLTDAVGDHEGPLIKLRSCSS